MSAGRFAIAVYDADYDVSQHHPIRIQPETALLTIPASGGGTISNVSPGATSTINNRLYATVSSSSRRRGLHCRYMYLKAPATGQPAGYKPEGVIKLPVLNKALTVLIVPGTTQATYLGAQWTIVGVYAERFV